jgi:hypothetical protein
MGYLMATSVLYIQRAMNRVMNGNGLKGGGSGLNKFPSQSYLSGTEKTHKLQSAPLE